MTPIEVLVHDEQTDHRIDARRWADLVSRVLAVEGVSGPGEATLMFIGVAAMTELNLVHMGIEAPTDVLSFPIDAADAIHGDHRLVGDIVVCPSMASLQASSHAGTFDDEVALLLVHGVLHLLGHDHAEPDERALMWRREQELLRECWRGLPASAWATS